jgi:redox-sensitive bicupin YhaK (pirin superfamily)
MTTNLKLNVRRAAERGHAHHGWLDTRHTFSFADYYDSAHMGFRSLRVINDDRIAGGCGFPTHPHRDMEIFSYLLSGQLAHKDSMGINRVLKPAEIQLMHAGSGVRNSEFNPSPTEPAHLLQIWIPPESRGLAPAYTEWTPAPGSEDEPKTLVISKNGRNGSATIAQDASIYLPKLKQGVETIHVREEGGGMWLHVASGNVTINGIDLTDDDSVSLEEAGKIDIVGTSGPSEAILFDLK